jgi:hypothetical protein
MNGMEYESGIEEETRNRLQSIARRKEWEYKHGIYGKRDLIELTELEEFRQGRGADA